MARELALRGAQIIFLTQYPLSDPFLVDFIDDLRESTNNHLLTAEQVDLADLHSIRKFATKWVDNSPPRRLDMIILCASTAASSKLDQSRTHAVDATEDGLELTWGINYVANFHLLSILSPAIRVQPPDRDVRIIFGACSSYMGGQLPDSDAAAGPDKSKANRSKKSGKGQAVDPARRNLYGSSKLALMTFANAFQKHLASYKRPDGASNMARVIMVDPGFTRTQGMIQYLTFGSLWGLLIYILLYPLLWLLLKSPNQGAQSFLYAAMEQRLETKEGGYLLKECRQVPITRPEVRDEAVQAKLWKATEETITLLEMATAKRRAAEKKEADEQTEGMGAKTKSTTDEKGGGSRGGQEAGGVRNRGKKAASSSKTTSKK